jgi:hypothetical protein
MHPTQHSTIPTRRPRGAQHDTTVADNAIVGAVRALASTRSTGYIYIAELRPVLGLGNMDLDWLRDALKRLDEAGRICLSTVELMAKLPPATAAWYARNASGIPCHEVCLSEAEQQREAELPKMTPGEAVRAMCDGLQLLWLNQPRHRPLLQHAAKRSQAFRVRTAPMPAA